MNVDTAENDFNMTLRNFDNFVLSRPEEERWELFDGHPFMLASPSSIHQDILGEIFHQFKLFFKNTKCKVRISPADVVLFNETDDPVVCQPDLFVFCDKKQDDGKRIYGPPRLALEVWSKGNENKDRTKRIIKFKEAGIQEIWEVNTIEGCVYINTLIDGDYVIHGFTFNQIGHSKIFPELSVDLSEFVDLKERI